MHYPTGPLFQWRQMQLWSLVPTLIPVLALSVACGDEDPTPARAEPTSPSAASVSDAGSEAAAEAALAAKDAAEQARVAAVAAQAAAEAAQAREGNRGREGTVYIPLRQALDRARQAADDIDAEVLETETQEVFSRFNAIFYLSTVRYIGRVYDDAQAGDRDTLGNHQVEALAFYRSIQPDVAKANPSADETKMAYLTADAIGITTASRDAALAAFNRVAVVIL